MNAPFAKFIDWSALQMAHVIVRMKPVPEDKWKLEEALEFLKGPEFLPAEIEAAQMEFDGRRRFRFRTPRPSGFEENDVVHGRLYRCADNWRERPAVILLDGSPSVGYHTLFPLLARRINRAGINAAALVAPFHHQRRPRRAVEENCLEFAREVAQGVAEIRALTGWLLKERCPSVGLVGFSFGAWLAGMTACSDTRIAAAVLTVPAVRMTCYQPVIWPRARKALQALRPAHEALDTMRLNLISTTPVIPKENILLIEGKYDLFAEKEPIEELWQTWRQPEIWRLSHGHISALFAPGLTARVVGWLSPRLEAGRKSSG